MKIFYVDPVNGNNNNNGLTKETAYTTFKNIRQTGLDRECYVYILLNDITINISSFSNHNNKKQPVIIIGINHNTITISNTSSSILSLTNNYKDYLLFFNITLECVGEFTIYTNDKAYDYIYFYNCILKSRINLSYNRNDYYGNKIRFCNNLIMNPITMPYSSPTIKNNLFSNLSDIYVTSNTDLSTNVIYTGDNYLLKDYSNIQNDIELFMDLDNSLINVYSIFKNIFISKAIKNKVKNIIFNNKLFQEHCVISEEE